MQSVNTFSSVFGESQFVLFRLVTVLPLVTAYTAALIVISVQFVSTLGNKQPDWGTMLNSLSRVCCSLELLHYSLYCPDAVRATGFSGLEYFF